MFLVNQQTYLTLKSHNLSPQNEKFYKELFRIFFVWIFQHSKSRPNLHTRNMWHHHFYHNENKSPILILRQRARAKLCEQQIWERTKLPIVVLILFRNEMLFCFVRGSLLNAERAIKSVDNETLTTLNVAIDEGASLFCLIKKVVKEREEIFGSKLLFSK